MHQCVELASYFFSKGDLNICSMNSEKQTESYLQELALQAWKFLMNQFLYQLVQQFHSNQVEFCFSDTHGNQQK